VSLTPVLISSPFLGPAVWAPVERELREDFGVPAMTVALNGSGAADPVAISAALRERLPQRDDLLLVPHSNAGLYVPSLLTAVPARGVVFVDAILPPPAGRLPVAPQRLRDLLSARADEAGLLPPWTEWWPEAVVAELFPNEATRELVASEQRRLPLAYLDAQVEAPAGWDRIPAAYLAFGDTYATEREDARSRGWPVRTMDGQHLHMLREPAAVAAAIMALAARATGADPEA